MEGLPDLWSPFATQLQCGPWNGGRKESSPLMAPRKDPFFLLILEKMSVKIFTVLVVLS